MTTSSNTTPNPVLVDVWNDLLDSDSILYPSDKVITLQSDPLDYVCSQIRQGKKPHEFYDDIDGIFDDRISESILKENICTEDILYANTIRRHFKNQYMLNRLKNKQLTKFESDLSEILENEKSLDRNKIRILVKLPEFYQYNKNTEEIFSRHISAQRSKDSYCEINAICKFAGSIEKNTTKKKYTAFYWTMPDNTLAVITVDHQEKAHNAWHYIAKLGKVGIRATVGYSTMIGGNFLVYRLDKNYELYNPEDK